MESNSEVYLRIKDDSQVFQFSFLYYVSDLNMNKQLYFTRSLSETVHSFLTRVSKKVVTILDSKKKKLKNKTTVCDDTKSVPVQLFKDGEPVSDKVICKNLFCEEENPNIVMKIGDLTYIVLKNLPWVQNIALSKRIMAGFGTYPCKLDLCFSNSEETEFSWYRLNETLNILEKEPIANGYIYTPTVEDIGCKLKLICTPKKHGIKGLSVETISPSIVEAGPGYCPYETRHIFTSNSLSGDSFRVVSYNILADAYASSSTGKNVLFNYCPPYALSIDYRKQLLLKELIGYNADIICLQEVDCKTFLVDLRSALTKHFDGVFTKKGGDVREGVACFYKKSRLKLLANHSFSLAEEAREKECLQHIWNAVSSNETLHMKLLDRTTAVQVLVFNYLEKENHKLVVANTHLYFQPTADNIRLLQAAMCLYFINDVVNKLKSEDSECTTSVIFNGDFNSTPGCGVFKLFTDNHIPESCDEWLTENEIITGLSLHNPINFGSACGTPIFTNYTPNFVGCLDYIFYQNNNLKVEQVIPLPAEEEMTAHTAIPSIVFPSDHVALVADLAWN